MGVRTSDPSAPFYKQLEHEGERDRQMYETIGRVVVAWGAAESALAKLWWHLAFQSGKKLDRDKVYREPTSKKLVELRKLTPSDNGRADNQLARLERAFPSLDEDRHALVHGYLGMTAKGPASINLRTDHATFAIDLTSLYEWAVYLADVAHQLLGEATSAIYDWNDERIYLPDPVEPAPYVRTTVPGLGVTLAR